MSSVPGIDEAHAKLLVARGFHDFSDIVRLALPEDAVKKGLHHAIARRALLAGLTPPAPRAEAEVPCPVCGSPWPAGGNRCPICGPTASTDLVVRTVEQKLKSIADELATMDPDDGAREMPDEVRTELLGAFRTRSVRIIRAQMLKKREGDRFLCPLCDAALRPEAEACENCGAKFV